MPAPGILRRQSEVSLSRNIPGNGCGFAGMTAERPVPFGANEREEADEEGGEETQILTVEEMPSHNHGIKSPSIYLCGDNPNRGDCWLIGYDKANHHGSLISETGGSQSHNNMPPYLAVYMWALIC